MLGHVWLMPSFLSKNFLLNILFLYLQGFIVGVKSSRCFRLRNCKMSGSVRYWWTGVTGIIDLLNFLRKSPWTTKVNIRPNHVALYTELKITVNVIHWLLKLKKFYVKIVMVWQGSLSLVSINLWQSGNNQKLYN